MAPKVRSMTTNPISTNSKGKPPVAGPLWLRVALSLFVAYHLLVVVLMPSGGSLEARALGPALVPYANTLGMNNTWVFFSPGPSPNIYLEYDLENGEMEALESAPRVFPVHKSGRLYSERYFRSLYIMRYFTLDPAKFERFLAPWLCRQHPEAGALTVRPVFEQVPGIEKAWSGESFSEMLERIDFERRRFTCGAAAPGPGGEE